MTASPDQASASGHVTVRYWASARAAAGVTCEAINVTGPTSLSTLISCLLERHSDRGFARVLESCSVLVGDRPVSSAIPDDVRVPPGQTVEFLPPFAGG